MSRCHARRSPRLGCGVAHPAVAAALAMLWCALAADAAAGSEYGEPKRVGTIDAPALSELSGLAASRETPGVFWVVNDGGHGARLYAISRRGTMLAQFEVPDARNRDWEALAVVSRPGRRAALYVGDIGDNAGGRDDLVIYRLPEPVVRPGGLARRTARPRVFPFRYPDGRHDAEAIAVDPRTGRIYVITKSLRGARLYRFPRPLQPGRQVTLQRVGGAAADGIASVRLATGAAVSPDGSRVDVRTYFGAVEFSRGRSRGLAGAFSREATPVVLAAERQGEAITYSPSGRAILTTSEGRPAPIWRVRARRVTSGRDGSRPQGPANALPFVLDARTVVAAGGPCGWCAPRTIEQRGR